MGKECNACLVLIMPSGLYALPSSPLLCEEVCFCVLIARRWEIHFLENSWGLPSGWLFDWDCYSS